MLVFARVEIFVRAEGGERLAMRFRIQNLTLVLCKQ